MTYRVGIIGLGIMGQRMLGNMEQHDAFDVVSVFDPARHVDGQPYAESAAALINDPDVDLVYIACPPDFHAEYAIATAEADKPVFCEKPLGVDLEQSRALVGTIEGAGVPNAVNFSFASSPSRMFLKRMLADGAFGGIEAIDIRLHFASWPRGWQEAASWLAERKQGGYVREVLSHFIYLTESVFGPATLEKSIVRYPDGPEGEAAESHVFADLSVGGVPLSVAGGVGGTGPDRIEFTVWGSDRSCRLDDWYTVNVSDGDAWHPDMTDIPDPRQTGRVRQLDSLAAFMAGEAHELPNFRAALSVQEIIEGILAHGLE
ncbi:MAG: Gfo/Idh/MocA family oxidoreductase [Rhodospirillales bacterium]|nr:Gfo/Idh/MocA family oxidoreductase [Rhodospirillales bacterium]MBO6788305.1 Gfo/Idh/MocA family oxidoreductase [Rhodospirillales bacterium]